MSGLVSAQRAPVTTPLPCALHKRHAPIPTYCEQHHIVPQAWQAFWTPPMSGTLDDDEMRMDLSALRLWDPRTIVLCRTAHGNVHFWLVRLMRAVETLNGNVDLAVTAARREARVFNLPFSYREVEVARTGMLRFARAGGDLHDLCEAGLYGEI